MYYARALWLAGLAFGCKQSGCFEAKTWGSFVAWVARRYGS